MSKVSVRVKIGRLIERGICYEQDKVFECERSRALSFGDDVEIIEPEAQNAEIPEPLPLGSKKKKIAKTTVTSPNFDSMVKPEDGFRG